MLLQQRSDVLPEWNSCWKTGILHSQGENKADTTFRFLSFLISVMLQIWPQPGKAPRVNVTIASPTYCWDLLMEEEDPEQMPLWGPTSRGSTNSSEPCSSEAKGRPVTLRGQQFKSTWSPLLRPKSPKMIGQDKPWSWRGERLQWRTVSTDQFPAYDMPISQAECAFHYCYDLHLYMDDHVRQTDSKKGRVDWTRTAPGITNTIIWK